MDIFRSPLVIIFKEQNPYRIIDNFFRYDNFKNNNSEIIDKGMFIKLYQEEEVQVSKDETINIFDLVNEEMKQNNNSRKSIFNLLINYNENLLDDCGDNVRCKYKELLKWRSVTLKLDPDMFICSFLAYKDLLKGSNRTVFSWDTIIKSNNIRLHNMLSKGMSENHFHLTGSAPIFKLNWVALMNNIYAKDMSDLDLESNRLGKDNDGYLRIKDLITVAALIRLILFKKLKNEHDDTKDQIDILKEIINIEDNGCYNINSELVKINSIEIQSEISSLKYLYGSRVEHNGSEQVVDYALTSNIQQHSKSMRVFMGERAFLYECFKKIYRNDDKDDFVNYEDLFYSYLIIKNKVRGELIQQNNKIGFSNFEDYQVRKSKYLKSSSLLKDCLETSAILTSIKTQNIKSIEARIVPDFHAGDNCKYIDNTDKKILNEIIGDKDNFWINGKLNELIGKCTENDLTLNEFKLLSADNSIELLLDKVKHKYFYVYHFPKSIDELECEGSEKFELNFKCRHSKYRQKLKKWAISLIEMREKNQEYSARVLGIDACANELVARPEVFGQAFRFLKDHLPAEDYLGKYRRMKALPRMRATFHVGEDFLDVVYGLRAIDEAINFLGLTHGDRLGHAIALGINVKEWYDDKKNRVYLSKQEVLDNIAWLIKKIKDYELNITTSSYDKLKGLYSKYYREIYVNNSSTTDNYKRIYKTDNSILPVDTYIDAWKLRGDNPENYLDYTNSNANDLLQNISYWNRCSQIKSEDDVMVRELYHRYHYDPVVKIEGYKKTVMKIDNYIMDIISIVQKEMQIELRKRGIGIETNPSSNVLISTFKRYEKHPILNMNNFGLQNRTDNINETTQVFVSINTDDQGVFDTLLENEYALMGIALEKAKNEDGSCKYNQSDIYRWLDSVRQMGIEQSFRIPRE
ncbi:hypothetical protein M4I33_06130 [Clostridium sp. LY3-2]|uniref:hypothetical protein n=1 Tax=Clostridium sp. LY3-2 TaxID=2942482 RepID=UPI002152F7FC|nr:hypothetical protein [Clostridium sp. LY3-2]MCR6514457.1 hypothetical protein [Clostridium sp. LY3-2]